MRLKGGVSIQPPRGGIDLLAVDQQLRRGEVEIGGNASGGHGRANEGAKALVEQGVVLFEKLVRVTLRFAQLAGAGLRIDHLQKISP
jgi:hypothetical protein